MGQGRGFWNPAPPWAAPTIFINDAGLLAWPQAKTNGSVSHARRCLRSDGTIGGGGSGPCHIVDALINEQWMIPPSASAAQDYRCDAEHTALWESSNISAGLVGSIGVTLNLNATRSWYIESQNQGFREARIDIRIWHVDDSGDILGSAMMVLKAQSSGGNGGP
jgi:hypothetical protein